MRILVVEDEADLNLLLCKVLTKAGYTVDGCLDGEDAQAHLLGAAYDGILLDVMLPKKDGYTLVRELRDQGNDTPVLFLTARDSVADRVKGLDLGGDDYLVKPFDFAELLARIRIPAPPAHSGSFYIKYTRRDAMDLALLGVSTYVELTGDTLKTVRIALTTAAPTPIRAFETERILTGRPAVEETFLTAGKAVLQESHPRSSWRSSAEFRLALLEELTAQALRQAAAVAKEA